MPVVTSFSLPDLSSSSSAAALTALTQTLDSVLPKRKTPVLYLGPPAAGSEPLAKDAIKTGASARQNFSLDVQQLVKDGDAEWLGFWNLTIQSENLESTGYGINVAIVEAMMVGRVPSSFLR